jgi:uncharacterized protein
VPTRRLPVVWTYRQGLAVLLCFVLLLAASSALHLGVVRWLYGIEQYLQGRPRMPPSLLITSQALKVAAILVTLHWLALRARGLDWRALGVRPCAPRWLGRAAMGALAGFVLGVLLAKWLVASLPAWAPMTASRYAWSDGPAWQMGLLLVLAILLTPLAEELFFRGFLLRWMASHRPLWLAMGVSALMFGASHLVPAQALVAALMSLLLGTLFLASGSIWPAVLCHVLYNALGVLLGMAGNAGALPAWLTPPG